jgi:hypothetical protein
MREMGGVVGIPSSKPTALSAREGLTFRGDEGFWPTNQTTSLDSLSLPDRVRLHRVLGTAY